MLGYQLDYWLIRHLTITRVWDAEYRDVAVSLISLSRSASKIKTNKKKELIKQRQIAFVELTSMEFAQCDNLIGNSTWIHERMNKKKNNKKEHHRHNLKMGNQTCLFYSFRGRQKHYDLQQLCSTRVHWGRGKSFCTINVFRAMEY